MIEWFMWGKRMEEIVWIEGGLKRVSLGRGRDGFNTSHLRLDACQCTNFVFRKVL